MDAEDTTMDKHPVLPVGTTAKSLIGATVEIAEADYCFGAGPLRIRVERVGAPELRGGARWVHVHGVEISWEGVDLGAREALVRADALTAAIRR